MRRFDIAAANTILSSQGLPYNYESYMHFKPRMYSVNGQPTIVPVNDSIPLEALGSALVPNSIDYLHLNLFYCGGKSLLGNSND